MVADSWGAAQKEATASGNTANTFPIYMSVCGRKLVQGFRNVWIPQFSWANRLQNTEGKRHKTAVAFENERLPSWSRREPFEGGGGTQIGTYSSYCDHRTLGCAIGVGGVPQKSAESRPGNFRKVL